MQSGWRVGSLFGIPLFVDNSWFLILTLITVAYGGAWQEEFGSQFGALTWVAGFGMAMLLFGSVLLHELGHSLVAKAQGIQVNSITLFMFGGIASIAQESKTPGGAFQVAIAGPAVSLGLFLGLTALLTVIQPSTLGQQVLGQVAYINLVLCLFNLIPGLPLDGGQVLKAAIWKVTGDRFKGVRWAARAGQLLGIVAIAIGLTTFLQTQDFGGLWIAFIGWFCLRNAANYNRVTSLQEALAELSSSDAMTREFRVVDANLTLREFADDYLLDDQRQTVYFAASDGRYRGLVSIEDVRQVERSQWEHQTLRDIARSLLDIPSIREDTPLTVAIDRLEADNLRRLTVLTPADAVAGILDRGDIVRALAKKLNIQISEELIQRIKDDGVYPPGLQLAALSKSISD